MSKTGGIVGILCALTTLLLFIWKASGMITISWWLVFVPILLPIGILILFLLVIVAILLLIAPFIVVAAIIAAIAERK